MMERFTAGQRATLLQVARCALTNCLVRGLPPRSAAHGAAAGACVEGGSLLTDAACFVTLWQGQHGNLRGCRGEYTPQRPLLHAVAHMALAAALDDPRFPPLDAAELPQLRIEISVLSPLSPIQPGAVQIGRHGLLLAVGSKRALLLPEVAVEHHLGREALLEALCAKAGLPTGAWRDPDAGLWSFETEAWEEPA